MILSECLLNKSYCFKLYHAKQRALGKLNFSGKTAWQVQLTETYRMAELMVQDVLHTLCDSSWWECVWLMHGWHWRTQSGYRQQIWSKKKKYVFNSATKQRLQWLDAFSNNCLHKGFLPGMRYCSVSSTCFCDRYPYYHLHCSSSQAHLNVSPWLGGTMIFFIPAGCLTCVESFLALNNMKE